MTNRSGLPPQVMLAGVDPQKARDRAVETEAALRAHGIVLSTGAAADEPAVTALVRTFVDGSTAFRLDGRPSFVARDGAGTVIGALVAEVRRDLRGALQIADVAVKPPWRRLGVASVLIEGAMQSFPDAPLVFGASSLQGARLYQKAGFYVLKPGAPLGIPGVGAAVNPNPAYPCWFVTFR